MDSIHEVFRCDDEAGNNHLINRTRLVINADVERKCMVILVEGKYDRKFINCMLPSSVVCFETDGGKLDLHTLLQSELLSDERIIAIRDRDYSNPSEYPDRMFAYDHSSLELMMLSHPSVQEKLKSIYEPEEERIGFPLDIMRVIAPFSLLRQKNERENLGLCLMKGVLSGLNGKEDRLPDMECLFRRFLAEEFWHECKEKAEMTEDAVLWDITNGHDICAVLGRVSRIAGKELGEKGYQEEMLLIYRKEDFHGTELYQALTAYHRKHGLSAMGGLMEGTADEI